MAQKNWDSIFYDKQLLHNLGFSFHHLCVYLNFCHLWLHICQSPNYKKCFFTWSVSDVILRIIFIILIRIDRGVVIKPNLSDLEVSSLTIFFIHKILITIKNRGGRTLSVGLMIRVVNHHSPWLILVFEVSSLLPSHLFSCADDRGSSTTRDEAGFQGGGEVVGKA